jgi:hypothetical protein
MAFDNTVKNAMLEVIDESSGATPITHISLHTADPGGTGASEVAGGSYARQAVVWGAASGGAKTNTNQMIFNIPPGTTTTHVGGWDAVTSGTWRGGGTLTASQPYPNGGTYRIEPGALTTTI